MILKEADPVRGDSYRAQAGARAEKDMAFYLRRAFGSHRPEVLVFHDLRFVYEGEVAQIDHLVVHCHGMFVIESKSVSGEIHISNSGQFVRHFGRGKRVGMPSPIEQARRQIELLRRLLNAHRTDLRERKLLGMLQGAFTHCPIEIRVAVSDHGIIEGEKYAPEVRKADLITQDIEERIAAHRRGSSLLNLDTKRDDGLYLLTPVELERIQRFLLQQHAPRADTEQMVPPSQTPAPPAPAPTPVAVRAPVRPTPTATPVRPTPPAPAREGPRPVAVQYLCSKCHSLDLRVLHGKYGYYFKCGACDGNTWIDTVIEVANGVERKGRIRKEGRDFFLVCPETGSERKFFTNPADCARDDFGGSANPRHSLRSDLLPPSGGHYRFL